LAQRRCRILRHTIKYSLNTTVDFFRALIINKKVLYCVDIDDIDIWIDELTFPSLTFRRNVANRTKGKTKNSVFHFVVFTFVPTFNVNLNNG
jgi:hypothetical protein